MKNNLILNIGDKLGWPKPVLLLISEGAETTVQIKLNKNQYKQLKSAGISIQG